MGVRIRRRQLGARQPTTAGWARAELAPANPNAHLSFSLGTSCADSPLRSAGRYRVFVTPAPHPLQPALIAAAVRRGGAGVQRPTVDAARGRRPVARPGTPRQRAARRRSTRSPGGTCCRWSAPSGLFRGELPQGIEIRRTRVGRRLRVAHRARGLEYRAPSRVCADAVAPTTMNPTTHKLVLAIDRIGPRFMAEPSRQVQAVDRL